WSGMLLALCCAGVLLAPAGAAQARKSSSTQHAAAKAPVRDGEAEARLIEIYKLVSRADTRAALAKAQALVKDHPNFSLAQLAYGDLLMAQRHPLRALGDVPDGAAEAGAQQLAELREESQLRMRALRERPPAGAIPAQFLQL